MKKVLQTVRSMRFGMLLLLPVLACSVLGSVVPQGESESLYIQNFPRLYHLILGLGIDRIFSGWFFLTLVGLFSLNLALCSASQLRAAFGRQAASLRAAGEGEILPAEGYDERKLEGYLRSRGWREQRTEGRKLWRSAGLSWYGSAITHFALLGIILAAAGIFLLVSDADYAVFPGDNYIDGDINIRLESFHIKDDSGRIDYASTLEVISPGGRSSGVREIRVNRPLRFGSKKYYQQTYGISGELTVYVKATGEEKPLHLTEQSMISAGGTEGIWYNAVYPGYLVDAEGNRQALDQPGMDFADPIYYIVALRDTSAGGTEPMLLLPGEELETSDAVYRFGKPMYYPGIRVKTTPFWAYGLLYLSFAAITLGLYLCFFVPAAAVAVDEKGYYIVSRKWENELRLRFDNIR